MPATIKRDSQNAKLLLHLAKGKPLTRHKALLIFGVQNFQARMSDLKALVETFDGTGFSHTIGNDGNIVKTTKVDPNGASFASYTIDCRGCRQKVGRYLQTLRRQASKTVRAA
jgi:hypothetical protein